MTDAPAAAARPLPFPAAAMSYSGTILGTRGAGKSTTARTLFEHELDLGHRCGFIDPMGDAAGIRLNPDGTPSRFQQVIIFGGPNGDIPITDQDGARVARVVSNANISFLVDLSQMMESEQFRFMTAFADLLYDEIKVPMLLLMDEAHLWAPQATRDAPSKLLNRIVRLNTQGRKRGIFLWLMTQRPARINKNVISGAECLIAMRVGMPRDIQVISEWLELHDAEHAADVKTHLAGLATGEAFVSIPLLKFYDRIRFDMPTTMDTGRTPQHGETIGGVVLPKIDIGDIGALFGATTDADPRDEEIQRLTDELTSIRQRMTAMRADTARLTLERDTAIATLTRAQDCIGMAIGSPRMHALKPGTDPTGWIMALDSYDEARPINAPMAHLEAVTAGARRMRNAIETDAGSTNFTPEAAMDEGEKIIDALGAAAGRLLAGLQPAQRKIVQAIAAGKGVPMPRTEIARLAGVSPTSSNVNAKLTQMAGNGLIELVNGDLFKFVGHR